MATFDSVLAARNTSAWKTIHGDDDDEHLMRCWQIQDCGRCLVSKDNCGWCPYSSTCVPLPQPNFPTSLLPNLLRPLAFKNICPLPWQERYELRTAPFGCNCSTTSFLVSAATILATLVGVLVLAYLIKICQWIGKAFSGNQGGWTLHVREEGTQVRWVEHVWVRRGEESWGQWVGRGWRRIWWGKSAGPHEEGLGEARPLLA